MKNALLVLCLSPLLASIDNTIDWRRHTQLHTSKKVFEDRRQYSIAAKHYEELIRIDPENREYLLGAATNFAKAGDFAKAEYWFMVTLSYYPDDIVTKLDLAQLYISEKSYEQAQVLAAQVYEEDPGNFRARIILMRLALLRGDQEQADRYLAELNVEDPSDPAVINATASYHLSGYDYQSAYDHLIDQYALNESEEVRLQLWGIRPYVKPSFSVSGLGAEELEDDLELKIRTTQINTWWYQFNGILPINNQFRIFTRVGLGPERQKNLLADAINYHVDIYSLSCGFETEFPPSWALTVLSNQKWGTNKGNVVFPFPTQFVWEPTVSLKHATPNTLFSATVYKDSFIGRDFNSQEAFFVTRNMAAVQYELRSDKNYSRLGGLGEFGYYGGKSNDNLKRSLAAWAVWDLNDGNLHNEFEYRFEYGNFWDIDPDYSSYRARWRQIGKYTMLKIFPGKGEVSWSYRFMRQTLRDFTTDSQIIIGQPSPADVLRHNQANAHTFEGRAMIILADLLELGFLGSYYKDTNDYVTGLWRVDFRVQF